MKEKNIVSWSESNLDPSEYKLSHCATITLYLYCLCEYSKFVNGENVKTVVPHLTYKWRHLLDNWKIF